MGNIALLRLLILLETVEVLILSLGAPQTQYFKVQTICC